MRHAFFTLVLVAQVASLAGVADAQTKIACVGDSITADPASWCVVLDQKLGSDYEVRNFGVSGTCALKGCDAPYWSTAQFGSSHDFGPDIVIIMLGTNDSKPSNWDRGKDQFAADYGALIDSYTSLATNPRVYDDRKRAEPDHRASCDDEDDHHDRRLCRVRRSDVRYESVQRFGPSALERAATPTRPEPAC